MLLTAWLGTQAQCPPSSAYATPYLEDFDTLSTGQTGSNFGNCYLSTTTSAPNWETNSGGTSSTATGPTSDKSGSGLYVYTETSGSSAGDTTSLITPDIDLSGVITPELTFWYHMYGEAIGSLEVDVWDGSTWTNELTINGEQQTANADPYRKAIVDLSSYSGTIKLRFFVTVGSTGSSFNCDVAIDEIDIHQAPACPQPTNLQLSTIGPFSATLAWTAVSNASGGYEVIYGSQGFNPQSGGTTVNTNNDSVQLSSLNGATTYEAYVIADCGTANGSSDTTGPLAFTTQCVAFTAPYSNNFDSENPDAPATCWAEYNNFNSSAHANVQVPSSFNTTQPYSGSRLLELYSYFGFGTSDTLMALSPEFSDMTAGDKQIKFYTATSDLASELYIATTSSQVPGTSYNIIDTVTFSAANTWQLQIIALDSANGYNGSDNHVVFLHNLGGTYDDIYIDDFTYETQPACPQLLGLNPNNLTNTSVDLSTLNNVSDFEVEWGPCGFNQGTGTLDSTSNGTINLSGLAGNTCYDAFIRRDCGSAGNSVWSGPFKFTTRCNPLSAPYSNNFDTDSLGAVPICWDNYFAGTNISLAAAEVQQASSFQPANSSPNHVRFYNYNIDTTWLISPAFSDLTAADKRVKFYARSSTTTTAGDLIVGTVSSPTNPSSFVALDTVAVTATYQNFIVPLDTANGYNGTHTYVVLVHDGGTFDTYYLDDFVYEDIPSCLASTNVTAVSDSSTSSSLFVRWNSGQGVNYEVEWGPVGYTPGSGAALGSMMVPDTFATITGLSAQTSYDIYVRDSCAVSGFSPYAGPASGPTSCPTLLPVSLPLNDGFENYSGPVTTSSSFHCGVTYSWSFENVSGNGTLAFANSAGSGPALPTAGASSAALTSESGTAPVYLILTANLANFANTASGIKLSYRLADHYWLSPSPSNGGNNVWVRGSQNDPWILVKDWTTLNASSTAVPDSFFLDAVLQANGQSLSATTQVRWGQQTPYALTGGFTTGGMSLDDVRLEEVTCPAPQNLRSIASIDTSAQLAWDDAGSAGNYQLWVGTAGFYQGSQTLGGFKTITSGDSLQLDTLSASTCYEFLVRSICGSGDTSLWSGPQTFCTPCAPAVAPYTQSFDQNGLPSCWASSEAAGDGWQYGQLGDAGYAAANAQERTGNGGYYAWVDFSGTDEETVLESQIIEVSALTTPGLTFQLYSNNTDGSATNILFVEAWDGGQWRQVDSIRGNFGGWTFQFANLSSFTYGANNDLIKLRLRAESGGNTADFENDLLVDEFMVDEFISCPPPTNLSLLTGSLRIDSAVVSWTTGGASNWRVSYGPAGTPAGGGTLISAGNDTLALGGLSSGTEYVVYVQDSCGPGDVSPWVGPFSFVTPYGTNFLETFDNSGYDKLGWEEAENPLGTPLNYGSSGWGSQDFANRPALGTATSVNIFSSNQYEWLISPSIYLDPAKTNLQVEFDAAVTEWLDTLQGYMGSDDSLALVISTDNGQTWDANNILWLATSQDTVDATGEHVIAPLSGYSGYVRFGFYASSGPNDDQEDNDFFFENFEVRTPPACANPTNLSARNVTTNSATVQWTPADSSGLGWQVILTTGNQTPANGTVYTASANDSVGLIGLMSATTYCAYVVEQCSAGFSDTTGPVCFTTACTPFAAPFRESFDADAVPNCWSRYETSGSGWEFGQLGDAGYAAANASETSGNGGYYAWIDHSGGDDSPVLETPDVNVNPLSNPELSFDFYSNNTDNSTINILYVEAWDGNAWTQVDSIRENNNNWVTKRLSLTGFSYGANLVKLRFRSEEGGGPSDFYNDLLIDEVAITDASCPAPDSLALASVNCDTATITWNSQSGGSILQYGPAGFTPGTGSFTGVVTSPYRLSGLPLDTDYDVWVADTCGGDTTAYAGPFTFSTDSVGPVNAAFSYQVLSVTDSNARVAFDASGATNAQSYQWSFGGGAMMDTISYATNGNKSVTLTVTGRCGATDDTTLTFTLSGIDLREWGTAALSVYPNPARESVKVSLSGYGSPYSVQLSDSRGAVVLERSDLKPGTPHQLSLKGLSPGVYIIKLQGADLRQTSRLMVR